MPIRVGVELAPVKGHAGASRRVEVFCGAGEQVLRWLSFAALTRMAYELGDTPGVRRAPSPPPLQSPPPRVPSLLQPGAGAMPDAPARQESRRGFGRGCPGAGYRGRRFQHRGSCKPRSRHPPAAAGVGALRGAPTPPPSSAPLAGDLPKTDMLCLAARRNTCRRGFCLRMVWFSTQTRY